MASNKMVDKGPYSRTCESVNLMKKLERLQSNLLFLEQRFKYLPFLPRNLRLFRLPRRFLQITDSRSAPSYLKITEVSNAALPTTAFLPT